MLDPHGSSVDQCALSMSYCRGELEMIELPYCSFFAPIGGNTDLDSIEAVKSGAE